MNKKQFIFTLACLLSILTSSIDQSAVVYGDTWGVNEGDGWTYLIDDSKTEKISVYVNSKTSSEITGRRSHINGGVDTSLNTKLNYYVSSEEDMEGIIKPNASLEERTYGGQTRTCYVCEDIEGYELLVVDVKTGIKLEIQGAREGYLDYEEFNYKLSSWYYEGSIFPYLLPVILPNIIVVAAIVAIVVYVVKKHKKSKQLKVESA